MAEPFLFMDILTQAETFARLNKTNNIVIPVADALQGTKAGIQYYQWFPGYRHFTSSKKATEHDKSGSLPRGIKYFKYR